MDSSSIRWNLTDFGDTSNSTSNPRSESKNFDLQLSMIPLDDEDRGNKSHITNIKHYVEESTFVRPNSLKSSSLLKLTDMLSQNILLHPFVALRRTCQVNRKCSPFICVQPFSLMSFMYHQQRKQGIAALYKGLSSELLVKGMALSTMSALANYADWPTEVTGSRRYFENSLKVMLLKSLSVAITTPFLCSSVIETVQSVIVVKDRPAFVDCLREGFFRLIHVRSTPSTRMLPIWLLILPTVCYHLAHSIIKSVTEKIITLFKSNLSTTRGSRDCYAPPQSHNQTKTLNNQSNIWQKTDLSPMVYNDSMNTSCSESEDIDLDSEKISTSIIASLITDITLLPLETILNSLYIQGTRTIIDNCDETTVVLPVITNYDGFSDCYQSILRFEGSLGLYKGLGAIVLQYSVHFIVFRSLYYILREINIQRQTTDKRNRNKFTPIRQQHIHNHDNSLGGQILDGHKSLHMQNARHSTPNNTTVGMSRISDENYRADGSLKHYKRI